MSENAKDPVVAYVGKNQTILFDNLKDVREAERLIEESNAVAEAIVNGDRGEATLQSAGEYSRKLHAEIARHLDRTKAYLGEYGDPKQGSVPAMLLQSSARCCEAMFDAVAGLDYIIANKGRGAVIAELARQN